jgi:hypothetical protein
MKNFLLFTISFIGVNLYSQRIVRSSIGSLGSTSKGSVSLIAATGISSPVSTPAILSSNKSIQTRPFIFASGKSGNNFQVSVFPNPTSNWIEIRSTGTIKETRVFDVANRLCYSGTLNRVNLEPYTVGIYTVTVLLEDNSIYCEKIILNK